MSYKKEIRILARKFIQDRGTTLHYDWFDGMICPDDPWAHRELMLFYMKILDTYHISFTDLVYLTTQEMYQLLVEEGRKPMVADLFFED